MKVKIMKEYVHCIRLYAIPTLKEVRIEPSETGRLRELLVPGNGFENWGAGTFRTVVSQEGDTWLNLIGTYLTNNRFSWEVEEIDSGAYVFFMKDGLE